MATAPTFRPPPIPPTPPVVGPPPRPTSENPVEQLGELMAILGQDPKYRGRILDLIQDASPGLVIPERAVAKAADEKITAEAKSLREENAKLADRLGKVEGGLQRKAWMDANGLDEDDMGAVEAFAKEHQIGKADSALDYFRKTELGRPRGTGGPVQMTEDSRKKLYKNPKEWAFAEAERILAESRRRRGA